MLWMAMHGSELFSAIPKNPKQQQLTSLFHCQQLHQ
jgi:hypothetical protein